MARKLNVKQAELRLKEAAREYQADDHKLSALLQAAINYGKAKIAAWRCRDNWKARKRLTVTNESQSPIAGSRRGTRFPTLGEEECQRFPRPYTKGSTDG